MGDENPKCGQMLYRLINLLETLGDRSLYISILPCVVPIHLLVQDVMLTDLQSSDFRIVRNRNLFASLFYSTQVIDQIASEMYSCGANELAWKDNFITRFIDAFTISRTSPLEHGEMVPSKTLVHNLYSWIRAHEEAQVMVASVLVVVGIWWMVRALLALVINLVCPLVLVVFAVVCVPQLRQPLLGQNYPALANLLRNILMKLADNIKTAE